MLYLYLATVSFARIVIKTGECSQLFFSYSSKAWIGLHKEEKAYYWIDGSDSLYHNWKEEHYTESQRDDDKCVLMNEEGKWELEKCQDKNYFICKQKMCK